MLRLPPDPAHHVAALRVLPVLDRMVLADEDLQRADQYAAEVKREALRAQEISAEGEEGLSGYLPIVEEAQHVVDGVRIGCSIAVSAARFRPQLTATAAPAEHF